MYEKFPNSDIWSSEYRAHHVCYNPQTNEMTMQLVKAEPTLREFFDEHIPFADDGFGNDFWIELSSGVIKKVYYDDDPLFQLMVAPSFISFCKSLRSSG